MVKHMLSKLRDVSLILSSGAGVGGRENKQTTNNIREKAASNLSPHCHTRKHPCDNSGICRKVLLKVKR